MLKQAMNLAWLLVIPLASGLCAAPAATLPVQPPAHGKSTVNSILVEAPTGTAAAATRQPAATLEAVQTSAPIPSLAPSPSVSGGAPGAIQSSLEIIPVSVDISVTYQTIDGFGATHNSLVYEGIGDVLGPELRAQAIDAAYKQVGLSLGNLEGALLESPGSYDQRSNDNGDPDLINWGGFQTFAADAIQASVLALAQPFGFTGFYLSQKINIRWASPWLDDLRKSDYPRYLDEAAEQVAAGSIYWRDTYGVVPRYVMLFNEPLSGNGELTDGSVQEVVDLVKAAGARLEREGFTDVKFVLPNEETVWKTLEIAGAVLADPVARKYAGAIGYHAYPYGFTYASIPSILSTSGAGQPEPGAVAERGQLRQLSQQYGLPVWMTEVSHGDVSPLSYDDFRGRAIHIHDELVYANASGYFGMNNMWDTISQQMHFGNTNLLDNSNEGTAVLIDTDQPKVYITGMGYAIGQYARWVKPGAVRVKAESPDPLLQVTAFRTPESSKLILVFINNGSAPKDIQVSTGTAKLAGTITGEQSTASQYWAPVPEFSAASPASFDATLPPESVTTFSLPLGRKSTGGGSSFTVYIPLINLQ